MFVFVRVMSFGITPIRLTFRRCSSCSPRSNVAFVVHCFQRQEKLRFSAGSMISSSPGILGRVGHHTSIRTSMFTPEKLFQRTMRLHRQARCTPPSAKSQFVLSYSWSSSLIFRRDVLSFGTSCCLSFSSRLNFLGQVRFPKSAKKMIFTAPASSTRGDIQIASPRPTSSNSTPSTASVVSPMPVGFRHSASHYTAIRSSQIN
jgi:hypothetical protein